jgi:type I restriction enzyme R subunit
VRRFLAPEEVSWKKTTFQLSPDFRGAKDDIAQLSQERKATLPDFRRAKANDTIRLYTHGSDQGGRTMHEIAELFDPTADFTITEHFRPHWSQAGAVAFITFRLHDSIPKEVIRRWDGLKQAWLQRKGFEGHWPDVIPTLDVRLRLQFLREFNRMRELYLDDCHGSCVLRRPEVSQIVYDSLLHFDGERYHMGDFVIMPNHVHLLAAFFTEDGMTKQCDSWLHYTAWQINKLLQRKGKLWAQEPFDHLVRSLDQYEYLRRYIADNPYKAKLKPGEYRYRQSPFAPANNAKSV